MAAKAWVANSNWEENAANTMGETSSPLVKLLVVTAAYSTLSNPFVLSL